MMLWDVSSSRPANQLVSNFTMHEAAKSNLMQDPRRSGRVTRAGRVGYLDASACVYALSRYSALRCLYPSVPSPWPRLCWPTIHAWCFFLASPWPRLCLAVLCSAVLCCTLLPSKTMCDSRFRIEYYTPPSFWPASRLYLFRILHPAYLTYRLTIPYLSGQLSLASPCLLVLSLPHECVR